ncbi:hypothetical protein, partial [Phocaeicola vulgatus]|uniref:hypothetical protein n=2 Tax=Phocaeicola vulgatus TaxID=821 RepID=UPI0015F479D6
GSGQVPYPGKEEDYERGGRRTQHVSGEEQVGQKGLAREACKKCDQVDIPSPAQHAAGRYQ